MHTRTASYSKLNSNIWKDILSHLAPVGRVFAEWKTTSGEISYMIVPDASKLGDETVTDDDDLRFDEIESLKVMQTLRPMGQLVVANDVDSCRRILVSIPYVHVMEIHGGIEITLKN